MNQNILFYSKKCKFCNDIMNLIIEIDNLDNFKILCIDKNSEKYPYIQKVPTLIVNNINHINWDMYNVNRIFCQKFTFLCTRVRKSIYT